MPANDITRWTVDLLESLENNRQRQLVTMQGPRAWCDAGLEALLDLEPAARLFSNRHAAPGAVTFDQAAACLGSEARLVLLDLFDGFDPDALCIAAGLVRSGGLLVLLSPRPADWDLASDRYACWQDGGRSRRAYFVEYFFEALQTESDIGLALTPQSRPESIPAMPVLEPTPLIDGRTAEQDDILRRVQPWLAGRERGILLLSAARGRGKSTCLGMLAARLQADGPVLVTARSRQAAAVLLQQAPAAVFMAPDRLLQEAPAARLLIVDEAASIPLSLLRQLAHRYPLLLMAATSGGYEGTGQGFMLRFVAELGDQLLEHYRIEDPVRWCRHDRLEACLGRCLMLPGENAAVDNVPLDAAGSKLRRVENPGAPENRALLRDVYALLCAAHYRTRPSDLRMLMENPDLVLVVAELRERVVGVALLNLEGGFDASLCEAVFLGRRRPRGHLLAQMLTAQAGARKFAGYRGLRVQRIAVSPGCRRQGIGSRLIEYAVRFGRDRGLDYLGASFALDPQTSNFWRRADCRLVHVSFAAGKSSGNHSVAVLRPLRAALNAELEKLRQRIQQQLPTWMTQFLQIMDADQVTALLRLADYRLAAGDLERHEIEAFTAGNRGFELCFASLQKYVMHRISQGAAQPDRLLVEKAVQNRDWDRLERASGCEGRRQLQRRLRTLVDALDKP